MKKLIWVGFVLAMLTGCSKQDRVELPGSYKNLENVKTFAPGSEPEMTIHFQKDQVFGDIETVLFDRMRDAAVDEAGRVYISDYGKLNVKVFDPDGSYLATIGREGSGPGEFRHLSDISVRSGNLYVWDGYQDMAIVFSLANFNHIYNVKLGKNKNEYAELKEATPSRFLVKKDGTILLEFLTVSNTEELAESWFKIERTGIYYTLDQNGNLDSGKMLELISGTNLTYRIQDAAMSASTNFYADGMAGLATNDEIVATPGDEFLVKIYNSSGVYQRSIYYPIERATLTADELSDNYSGLFKTAIGLLELPETWPAIRFMLTDDKNRIWVATIVEDKEVYEWWVLRNEGELVATFTWPRSKNIQVVKDNFLYARETDDNSGIQKTVRYRINLKTIQ